MGATGDEKSWHGTARARGGNLVTGVFTRGECTYMVVIVILLHGYSLDANLVT